MNGHIHGEDALRLASPMYPAASFRRVSEFDHVDHVFRGLNSLECAEVHWLCSTRTEIDDVENFCTPVLRHAGKQLPIRAC